MFSPTATKALAAIDTIPLLLWLHLHSLRYLEYPTQVSLYKSQASLHLSVAHAQLVLTQRQNKLVRQMERFLTPLDVSQESIWWRAQRKRLERGCGTWTVIGQSLYLSHTSWLIRFFLLPVKPDNSRFSFGARGDNSCVSPPCGEPQCVLCCTDNKPAFHFFLMESRGTSHMVHDGHGMTSWLWCLDLNFMQIRHI